MNALFSNKRKHPKNSLSNGEKSAKIWRENNEGVVIAVSPVLAPFAFQEDHLSEGMFVRITCAVSRGDTPLTIRWQKDGSAIDEDLGAVIRLFDEYSSILSIDGVSHRHNGEYSCV